MKTKKKEVNPYNMVHIRIFKDSITVQEGFADYLKDYKEIMIKKICDDYIENMPSRLNEIELEMIVKGGKKNEKIRKKR